MRLDAIADGKLGVSEATFGVDISTMPADRVCAAILGGPLAGSGARAVFTINLDHVVKLRGDARFRRAYRNAWLKVIDGFPVFIYARIRGGAVPSRIPGPDLFEAVIRGLDSGAHRPFFVTSTDTVLEKLSTFLVEGGFPPSQVAGVSPPLGFEDDEEYSRGLANAILQHCATHLFFGVGSPKSEIWIDQYGEQLGDLYALSLGAGLDFFVGESVRAPRWLRRAGGEWVWRLASDPKRLSRRYLLESWGFASAVWDDLFARSTEK
ncbi:MAG: WecB/TagA/CpsF family glycosyltransferase [Polynucleobacter sp.]|nr:WecB/TagA/CpsF family glycosyltransferase [Polynucleobacter sp.]